MKYVATLTEVLRRTIIIEAEDLEDADDEVYFLMEEDRLNLTHDDLDTDSVTIKEATEEDLKNFKEYKREEY